MEGERFEFLKPAYDKAQWLRRLRTGRTAVKRGSSRAH